jgi:hypothetical protein
MQPGRSVPLFREALLKGTLTRLRLGAKTMSSQTSLQRTEHQSPERHHLFHAVGIATPAEAGTTGKMYNEKTASQRRRYPHAQNKTQKSGLTKAGTLYSYQLYRPDR